MPKDDLNSRQLAQIVDLLCEGEIEGFPNAKHPDGVKISHGLVPDQYAIGALKDVFFNNTPVLGPDAPVLNNSKITDPDIQQHLNFDVDRAEFQVELGSQDQPPLTKFPGSTSSSTTQVNTEVPKGSVPAKTDHQRFFESDGTPVVRSISDADVDQVNIVVGVPALTRVKDNGTVKGTGVRYKIQIQYNGDSGFVNVPISGSTDEVDNEGDLGDGNFQIDGYTPDLFQRTHTITLATKTTNSDGNIVNNTAKYPVNIRVIRTSQEVRGDEDTIQDTLIWYSFDQLITDKLRYPNSAVFGFQFDAQQFPSIPKRTFRVRGLKIRIPHNASVRGDGSLEYAGTFNGTFKAAREWCNDPAWILYDLLTNTRYGLGAYILTPAERKEAEANAGDKFEGTTDVAANLDVYSFQQASAYCSGRVSNNAGGTEARFSCNVAITSQQDAYKLVQQLCSVFRAMPFWEAGTSTAGTGGISLAHDRPEDFVYIFNQSNVTQEGFSYSGSSMKGRPTCVSVRYFDMEARDFRQELVELNSQFIDSTDPNVDFLDKYGYNKQEIDAFACTSKSQAYRLGKWFLYTSHRETEVCSFSTDIAAGIIVRPGDYIKISDPVRTGRVVAGRVTSGSTLTQVKLDRTDVDMFGETAPVGFEFHTIDTDGKYTQVGGSNIVGNTVTLGTALNSLAEPRKVPAAGAPFQIGYQDVILTQWRVLSVEEGDGVYNIAAAAHVREKYNIIEDESYVFPPRSYTQLAATPDPVTNLRLEEVLYEEGDKTLQRITVNWQQSIRANYYEVEYRFEADNPIKVIVQSTGYDILNSEIGTYNVKVRAVGYDLDDARTGDRHKYSSAASARITAVGRTLPPSNIASLNITPIDQHNAELHWPESTDLDVKIGGAIEIRHNPRTSGEIKWSESEKIVPAVNGSTTRKIVPLKDGHYLVRAKNSNNLYAPLVGIPSVKVELPEPQDLEVVQTFTESPNFTGTLSQSFNSVDEGGITLVADGKIDEITDFDSVTNIDFFGDVVSVGSYIFANTLDMGAVYDVELLANLQMKSINPDDFWDSRSNNIDTWDDIDADDLSETNAELYSRSTNDDPGGSPTYGTWEPFANSTKRGRGFQFKVEMETGNDSQDPVVQTLGVTVSLQRRTEQQRNISSGTGAKAITFPSAFYSTPSITITATNMATGDFFELSSVSRTGFTITFKASGGSIVDRTFDYQAVGHGKEIT
jgi:predicted phage tail protein